ncbi:Exportin-2 [Aphelenchoides bicaudatus]|nr:Exportin-2 [Aphelenchoides bicaudatus]
MDQQFSAIVDVLNRTTSASGNEIKWAEDELIGYSKINGYAEILLQILSNQQAEPRSRLAASVALKNFIRNNWNPENNFAVAPLEESERVRLRERILSQMFALSGAYRRQLSQSVCIIADQLDGGDFDRIDAALSTIEQLVKHYRYEVKSAELFREIQIVLNSAAPQLTRLYQRMLALSEVDQQQWFEIVLMEVKCYYSLVWQDFPAFFEDHLQIWMEGFDKLLKMKIVDSYADDNDASSFDDIRRVICNIYRLFAQRYEEDFSPYMMNSINTVWQLLVDTDHRIRFDSLVNSALGFLSAVSEKDRYLQIFNQDGVLEAICENGLDSETRRRGAADFVRSLTKHFEERVFGILSKSITSYLNDYSQNPSKEWVKKDVVYFLVSALASKATTARHGATSTSQLINITDFYAQYVRNDLFNVDFNTFPPILIADALNFVVLFRNHLQPNAILEIFGGQQPVSLQILNSQRRILHHYVSYAFDKIYMIKRDNAPLLSSQNIPVQMYIERLCQALQGEWSHKSHYLVKALLRSLSMMDQSAVQNSNNYIVYLLQLVEQVVKESQNATFTHMVFESVCVVIKKAFPYIQGSIGSHLMPVIEQIFERDIIDFVPYALQLVALLLYQVSGEQKLGRTVENAQSYDGFFQHLLTSKFWHRPVNAPALTSVFEAYVRTKPDLVLSNENISAVMGLYSKLISERSWEEHGFRVATILLRHYERNELITSRNILMPMLNRMQGSKTIRFSRSFVMFLCRFADIRGGMALAEALNGIQVGMYNMVVEKIIIAELSTPIARNNEDKKKLVLGLSQMIGDTSGLLGELYPKLVDLAISVVEATSTRRADDGEETNDAEYSDPFCKLSNLQSEEEAVVEVDMKRKLLELTQLRQSIQQNARVR